MARKLITKIGFLEVGSIFWTDRLDGGPFRLLHTDEPAHEPQLRPNDVRRFIEGKSFASAVRVDDGGMVTFDATHPAWVLSKFPQRR